MRTTLDIPDALGRRAKLLAVRRGISFKRLVTEAIEQILDATSSKPSGRPLAFPLVRSHKPGSMNLKPDEIHALLVREEAAAYETAMRR